jgi:predicted methyltransferase
LLARAVAPNGIVYAQNSKEVLERIVKTKFDDRFAHSSLKNVVKVVRDADDPTPPDARDLDLVTMFLTYHDTTFMGVDRPRMMKSLFAALKPGGTLVVIDHAAAPGGVPAEVGKTLHRIDEHLLESEVEAAGFKLVEESNFLRNPQDPKDAPFFKMTTPTDQFALKFRRP